MTNDDLRALADALSVPHRDLATVDVIRAADYLRAQADAQPVAWRSKIEGKTKDYWIIQQSEWLAREQPAWEPLYSRAQQMEPAMSNESHPAPAAPQAEPKREPLTALRILEIEDNASRQWRDNGRIIEYAVVFARMIESAHGIRGSDE